MTIYPHRPHVSYIFGVLGQNPVQWRWPQASWSPSGMSRWSGMSSKYREVLDDYFSSQTPCILYFWKPWAISWSMEMTPSIMIKIIFLKSVNYISQKWKLYFSKMKIVFLKNENCISQKWKLYFSKIKIVFLKNENYISQNWNLYFSKIKLLFPTNENCISQKWKLYFSKMKIVFLKN